MEREAEEHSTIVPRGSGEGAPSQCGGLWKNFWNFLVNLYILVLFGRHWLKFVEAKKYSHSSIFIGVIAPFAPATPGIDATGYGSVFQPGFRKT